MSIAMMTPPAWTEGRIATLLCRETFQRRCVLLVDRCSWTGYECDVLGVTTDLRIIDVEIKISRADLKADAKKDKWWHRTFAGYGERREVHNADGRLIRVEQPSLYDSQALSHPRKVWKHYFCLPADIWRDDLLQALPSPDSGVVLVGRRDNGTEWITVQRHARPNRDAARLTPQQVMDIARLANLRMWGAYEGLAAAERDARYWRQAAVGAVQEAAE